ncbi:hypothetical protein Tco_0698358 [Tanacetum coccineum]
MESLNSNSQERVALVATNAKQCKGKLHDIVSAYFIHVYRCLSYEVNQNPGALDKEDIQEDKSNLAFWGAQQSVSEFHIDWQYYLDMITQMSKIDTGSALDADSCKALDASLVVTECNGIKSDEHTTRNSSGTYITHAVQLTAQHNVLANEQQHTEQSEPIYDTYLLEKVDSNTTPDSTNMCHRGGEIDQDAEQFQAKSPLLKAEFLKMNDMVEKEVYNDVPEFCEFCEINDLKAQLQAKTTLICNLKNQIKSVKEASNEAKVKHEIDALEIINIELESSVAKLLAENENFTTTQKPFIVRQPNSAFKSKRPNFSKPRFASQVDVNNVLSKPVTPHYLPKVREYVLAKPHHVIAPGSSRNSQEESYGSNDMAHNHYLEEARKKTQERNRNSKPSVMHTTSLQNTTNGSKPNPRSNNQISRSLPVSKSSCGMSNGVSLVDHSRNSSSFSDSKHFVCSTCHKCVFNANHDNCITKFLKEVNSRAKVQSPKTRNNNKLVEPKSHTQKPSRQIAIGQRFSPKKSSAVHEKPNTPRSCLRWKPTGRIFKIAGLRWIPTGKMFTDNTTKVDSEPPNGSNDDITNPYECNQTL